MLILFIRCSKKLWVPGISDSVSGFVQEMNMAKSYGIDGWAINTAQWHSAAWPIQRMQKMVQAAEQAGFKFFMSADMTQEFIGAPNAVVDMVSTVATSSAYYRVNGKAFLSTFVGQSVGWNWQNSVLNPLASKGFSIYFVPFFGGDPNQVAQQFPFVDGYFHWTAWPYLNGNLQVVDPATDKQYRQIANQRGKVFMAPVSPYFAKHYCGLPSDALPNYVFGNYRGAGLWVEHWQQLIQIGPDYIEIVTWNDYPESSYIGPITAQWGITGNCNGNGPVMYDRSSFPHDAYADLGRYFIQAYKQGSYPTVTQDKVYVFYRGFSKNQQCNDPTGLGPVQNAQSMDDQIYVVSLLKSPATVRLATGGTTINFSVGSGLQVNNVAWGLGSQSVTVLRGGQQVAQKTFAKQISTQCTDGDLYDMNTFADYVSF
eukprot:TRINITY_DN7661_c0_g1_i3.p1 TRINITY_DN7661_c0_g1~~TRINITY_DN7661_c0_g1_i3.p1  ORF type:complete len:427 (+),score=65.25 TRINITY_DN7661_c0_g1_i3:274-1554(+)